MSSKSLLLHSYTECFTQNDLSLIEITVKYRHSGDTLPMTLEFVIRIISHSYLQYNYVTYKQEISTKQEMMIKHRTYD